MANLKEPLLVSLFFVLLAFSIHGVSASTQHFSLNVPPGRQQIPVDLRKGDAVQFYISSVTSTLGRDEIDFSIITGGSNGNAVYSQTNLFTLRDSYTAQTDGAFYLTFDNNSPILTKVVEIDVTTVPGSPCIIATAAFGSELAGPVQFLRGFRDQDVAKTYLGREFLLAFNAWYYSWAPPVAGAERANGYLRSSMRILILPLLGVLIVSSELFRVLAPLNADAAILLIGFLASALLGIIYLSPFSLLVSNLSKRRLTGKTLGGIVMLGVALTLFGTIFHGITGIIQIATSLMVIETILCTAALAPRFVVSIISVRRTTPLTSASGYSSSHSTGADQGNRA